MNHQRLLLLAMFLSPALVLTAVTILIAALGWRALAVLFVGFLIVVATLSLRDVIQDMLERI